MEKLRKERVERIIGLIEWFEEFQPNDLEQIERFLLGFRYVDNEVVENDLRQNLYRNIKNIKLDKHLEVSYGFVNAIFRYDENERMKNK